MSAPTATLVRPLLRVPYVASDALTVAVAAVGRPSPAAVGFRAYKPADTPPSFHVKDLDSPDPAITTYFTWDGLVPGEVYQIEAYAENADGASATDLETVAWQPENDLFPGPSVLYPTGDRPWRFEDYLDQWLALLPWYYESEPFTAQFLLRVGQEFQRLAAAFEQVERYTSPSLAYDEGLRRWELLLGIRPPETLSAERRRAMVLAHLRGRLDPSASLLQESLRNILDKDPRILESFNAFAVTIDTEGDPQVQAVVEEIVDRIIPAHLVVTFSPTNVLADFPERRAPLYPFWPRGRATQRPSGVKVGGANSGGLS